MPTLIVVIQRAVTMMSFSKLCVAVTLLGIVEALCTVSWWSQRERRTNHNGPSSCNEYDYFMIGIHRDHLEENDGLHLIKGVVCCKAPHRFSNSEVITHYEDWGILFLKSSDVWAKCPRGFFLNGFSRYSNGDAINYLHNIEYARCIKPSDHPNYQGNCYIQYINFNKLGFFSCKEQYFIAGLHKVKGDYLHHIDKLYCCTMQEDPEFVFNVDNFKRIIMEHTLPKLTMLAYAMGYNHIGGLKAMMLGDDYFRDGDSWVPDTRCYGGVKNCCAVNCEEILKIDYLNWSFHIKDIVYGNSMIDELRPEKLYQKEFPNYGNVSVTTIFNSKHKVLPSLKHTFTSHWNPEYIALLEYDPEYFGDITRYIQQSAEDSRFNTSADGKKELNNILTYSIPAKTIAVYKTFLNKIRTTTPYKANFVAKFNVRLTGILQPHNLHHQYKGSQKQPKVTYTFGDESEPFYTALTRQMTTRALPWLWDDMDYYYYSIRHEPHLRNETKYQLKLKGKIEYVTGKRIHTFIELKNLTRAPSVRQKRQTETSDKQIISTETSDKQIISTEIYNFNDTFIAKAGADDQPVEVNYPEVSSEGENTIEAEPIFNYPDSS